MHDDDAHPSTAAILGHPIHPMLVPIPIGALTLAFATDLIAQGNSDRFWPKASQWLLMTGAAGAAVAAPFGAIDFLTISRARELPSAWLHAGGNLTVLGLTVANLALRRGADRRVSRVGLGLSAVGAGLLAATGWLGGELSYRHRIGVMEQDTDTPESEGRMDGQIDAFGGHSAIAGGGITPTEAEEVARDLAAAELPTLEPDATAEARSGGG